jgi:hypothetical protein
MTTPDGTGCDGGGGQAALRRVRAAAERRRERAAARREGRLSRMAEEHAAAMERHRVLARQLQVRIPSALSLIVQQPLTLGAIVYR